MYLLVQSALSFYRRVRRTKILSPIIMRLAFFILLVTCLQVRGNAYSQRINLSGKELSLEKILWMIGQQSGYQIVYNPDLVKNARNLDLNVKDAPLREVLDLCLKNQGLSYLVRYNTIILKSATGVGEKEGTAAPPVTVRGHVTDDKGQPLERVGVQEKGTANGVYSDKKGDFEIHVKDGNAVLLFKYLGYTPKEMPVNNQPYMEVQLIPSAIGIDSVVVTGFNTKQKKISIVGAITTISPQELKTPSSTLSSSFAGRLSGVIARQSTGEPGSGAQFWIRGVSTYGGTGALIFLNGVEISSGDLNSIDPSNIESFSILKDASSTALYGARGANGVILIETKHGKILEKPRITGLVESAVSSPTKIVKFTDGVSYMKLYNEALRNDNPYNADRYSPEKINGTAQGLDPYIYPNINWYKMLFKDYAFSHHANLNVQGGGQVARYYMGVAYYKDMGILNNGLLTGFKNNIDNNRFNFVNNVSVKATKTTELELNINADYYRNTGPATSASSLFGSVMGANGVDFPAYYPTPADGALDHIYFGNKTDGFLGANTRDNPYADMIKGYSQSAASTLLTTLRGKQQLDMITKGLSFNALISFKNWSSSSINRTYTPYYYTLDSYRKDPDGKYVYNLNWIAAAGGSTALGQSGDNNGDRTLYMQTTLNYNRVFRDKHDVAGMLVFLRNEYNTNTPGDNIVDALPSRKQGWAGRLAYGYDSRYYLEANLGYTGSENFAAGHRYGFFPAGGISWVASNEMFFKAATWTSHINLLKIRASYGLSGNDQIGGDRFPYLSVVNMSGKNGFTTGYNFDNSMSGIQITRYPNNNIQWEISKKLNIGLDLGLFNDLTLNVDWFREMRSNIYQQRGTIPATAGVLSALPYSNIGRVLNHGIDATLLYNRMINKDLAISFRGTFTYARNKILYYDQPNYAALGLGNLSYIGHPLNTNFGLIAERLFIDDKEAANSPVFIASHAGDIKYKDLNGDGTINNNDRVAMGWPRVPEIVYGAGFTVTYKKIDVGIFFQGLSHMSDYISGFRPFGRSQNNMIAAIADSHWSPDNQNLYAFYPRLTALESAPNNEQSSSWWLRNFSFLRLKQVEVGYNPAKFARVYLRGINLLTFSKFKLWDPEQGGGNGLGYPPQEVVNLGAQFNL
ncbi:MAG: TonB-dependent receptor [Chitinophaga sp.]|uniref:TonB-dependent receptor n=1 Tax=Chitinophaga sp. TaxID=1869181 RepID=UPI0025B932F2|nr:TonB-dependent receptor [Chitinophaga sp.]MBV8251433.1 TonB-dependent receptor [Chitinophaga sp.]